MPVKLVSLNVERLKYKNDVLRLFGSEVPDIVCLQECPERDLAELEKFLDMESHFAPLARHSSLEGNNVIGVATFASNLRQARPPIYYAGSKERALSMPPHTKFVSHPLLITEFCENGKLYRILNTHFPWSRGGRPDLNQERLIYALLYELETAKEFVFCADMNAPRGGPIYRKLEDRFFDQVPLRYKTSIDPERHRAGALELMVDCLFTKGYGARDVRLQFGVSDHAAIIATIEAR